MERGFSSIGVLKWSDHEKNRIDLMGYKPEFYPPSRDFILHRFLPPDPNTQSVAVFDYSWLKAHIGKIVVPTEIVAESPIEKTEVAMFILPGETKVFTSSDS